MSFQICTLSMNHDIVRNMLANLSKGLKYGKECTLRSCVRLRAAGRVRSDADGIRGTLRFEAVVPDVSFQAVRIRPLPLLTTPLSLNLTRQGGNSSRELPNMGYLTLNQTRKVVPLLSTDPALAMAPIVGVWTTLDDSHDESYLKQPTLWAACTWYLLNNKACDKAFISEGTFLLANFGCMSVTYYEITRVGGGLRSVGEDPEYTCCDFTVDLNADSVCDVHDPVLCKFRPLSQGSLISSFRSAAAAGTKNDSNIRAFTETSGEVLPSEAALSEVQILSASTRLAKVQSQQRIQSLQGTYANRLNEAQSMPSETDTPLPRDISGLPTPSPGRVGMSVEASPHGSAVHALRGSQELSGGQSGNAGSAAALVAAAQYPASFPAEIILSQQMQLDAMREQIRALEQVIRQLGGVVPAVAENPAKLSIQESTPVLVPVAVPAQEGLYRHIPPRAVARGQSPTHVAISSSPITASTNVSDSSLNERKEDVPMRLIRAESPVMGKQNDARPQGRSALELDPSLSTKTRSSYNQINPLDSASLHHPALRPLGEEEAELMEPGLLNAPRYGTSSFPGPAMDGQDVGEFIDDYNSDEDRMRAIHDYHLNKYSTHMTHTSLGKDQMSSRDSSVRSSQETDTLGALNQSFGSAEGISAYETESILAIEARYR